MKDPLQSTQTPYEILGLARGASEVEIDQAFKQGLVKRGNVQKLMAAKNILQRPAERALLDLFQYDPQVLPRLQPNPLQDPSSLHPSRRKETAAAWEKMLATAFPDAGIAHSLGVLWYWWVLNGEERQAAGDAAVEPPLEEGWRRVIAYWAMLVSTDEYWQGQAGAEVAHTLRGQAVERLRNEFNDLGQKYRTSGATATADRYQGLDLLLTTEVRTAKDVAGAGLRTSRGKIACGLLLLEQLGWVESVKQQVDAGLEKNPASEQLLAVRRALSPYARIEVLLDQQKPQAAVEAIDQFSEEERQKLELLKLRARAMLEWGKQQASLGDIPKALDCWEDALGKGIIGCPTCKREAQEKLKDGSYWRSWCSQSFALKKAVRRRISKVEMGELEGQIKTEIVNACQARAAALQQQPEQAIAILEKGLELVDNEKLKLTLAEILTQRGISRINEAQKKLESEKKGATPEILKMLKAGRRT